MQRGALAFPRDRSFPGGVVNEVAPEAPLSANRQPLALIARTIAFRFSPMRSLLALRRHLNHADRRGLARAARLHSRGSALGGAAERACAMPRTR